MAAASGDTYANTLISSMPKEQLETLHTSILKLWKKERDSLLSKSISIVIKVILVDVMKSSKWDSMTSTQKINEFKNHVIGVILNEFRRFLVKYCDEKKLPELQTTLNLTFTQTTKFLTEVVTFVDASEIKIEESKGGKRRKYSRSRSRRKHRRNRSSSRHKRRYSKRRNTKKNK